MTIGVWLALGFAALAPAVFAEVPRPKALDGVAFEQRLGAELPKGLEFRDETGVPVRFGDLLGDRPIILSFAYYHCPMLCPLALSGLASSLKTLSWNVGEEFRVVTVGIDPKETPAQAAAAKQKQLDLYRRDGAAEGWRFLTGEESAIRALADAAGFRYNYDATTDQYAHAAGIVVVTPEGEVSRYLYGFEFAPRDLRLALVEAGDGKIGSLTDQLLLLCFHWDPTTGKYGGIAMGAVRTASALTLLGLGGFMLTMWRRERRAGDREGSGSSGNTSADPPSGGAGRPRSS